MRPLERGPIPIENGQSKVVSDYKDWRFDLIQRIGFYCSYCNIPLKDSPQVEHIVPKTPVPALKLTWSNMLLACGACNSIKNDDLCSTALHFLPDYHNTHLAFDYHLIPHPIIPMRIACIVIQRAGLNLSQQAKAQATIDLCGLNRVPTTKRLIGRASVMRWHYRYETFLLAKRYRLKWDTLPKGTYDNILLDCLRDLVQAYGFFSIWFNAFHDVPSVKEMLINAFPATAKNCFPAPSYSPIERVNGDL